MNRKKTIVALATTAIVIMMITSMFYALTTVSAVPFTYTQNNVTIAGVLATDNYVLFPWAEKSLTIGFSKYGEMIDTNTITGLEYNGKNIATGTDPFAPFGTKIDPFQWIEGWVLNMTYASATGYHNIWAFALHSDYYNASSVGGPWKEGVTGGAMNLAFLGGRKTNGGAVTAPIEVLYNGPRTFIALLNTTIYETKVHDIPLLSITFTILFNKVTKQVEILKNLKRIDYGKNYGSMQVEFGDRGEWDLGPAPTSGPHNGIPFSSAYIFENLTTPYNSDYQSWYADAPANFEGTYDVAQIISNSTPQYVGWAAFWPKPIAIQVFSTEGTGQILRKGILSSVTTKTEDHIATYDGQTDFTAYGIPYPVPQSNGTGIFWEPDPMVFVNDQLVATNGTTSPPYNVALYFAGNHTVRFPANYISEGDVVKLVYKEHKHQDAMGTPLGSPFVIGEWAFLMAAPGETFRGVTVYGVTDRNDGVNAGVNSILDSEAQYFLDSIFNPYDLQQAVEKDESRWVQFFSGNGTEKNFKLSWNYTTDGALLEGSWLNPGSDWPYYLHTSWDEYSSDAERIEVNGVLAAPTGSSATHFNDKFTWNYTMTFNATGTKTDKYMWINFTSPPPVGIKNIKVLYSTDGRHFLDYYGKTKAAWDENVLERGQYEWVVVGKPAASVDSLGAAYVTEAFDSIKDIDVLKAGLDVQDTTYGPSVPWVMGCLTKDSLGRAYLKDDWCTTYPISSSQMIFVGGPSANLGTYYFNDFGNAFAPATGNGNYVVNNTGQAGTILARTCWSRNTYVPTYGTGVNNETLGYGVISVYQDLNGTTGLSLWGYTGQDTYYVTQWFWNYPAGIPLPGYGTADFQTPPSMPNGIAYSGIQYLQHENCGVTDIILQINYAAHTSTYGGVIHYFDWSHPEITIAYNERLGTISEKGQHDP